MLAKDLKAGQKFTYVYGNDEECTAIGVTDYCDDVYYTSRYSGGVEVDYINSDTEVTLVEEKPALSYADRQAAWVEEHGLKVGDKVKVTRVPKDREDGWDDVSCPGMSKMVGSEFPVRRIGGGLEINDTWFPFFVLEPVKPTVDPGEGYRLLGQDEKVLEGDEFLYYDEGRWEKSNNWRSCSGEQGGGLAYRRKIAEPVKPTVDAGEGYRLLGPDEKVVEGDEFQYYNEGRWEKSNNWKVARGEQGGGLNYRRKIAEPAEPSVAPGDGWRLLGPDEICQKGDERKDEGLSDWLRVIDGIGQVVRAYKTKFYFVQAVRRKVEPTYRPYTAEEAAAIVGKVVMLKEDPNCKAVVTCSSPEDECVYCGPITETNAGLLREFTFLDGTPCGVAE